MWVVSICHIISILSIIYFYRYRRVNRTCLAASSTNSLADVDTWSTIGFSCLTPSASAVLTCVDTSPVIGCSFLARSCAKGLILSCTAWSRAGFSSAAVLSTSVLASDATWLTVDCCSGAAATGAVAGAAGFS